jgi:two-component system cell cycle response regulator
MPASLKVLLVSHDRATLRRVSRFLRTFGYEVEQCTETARGAAHLAANRPDFLIVDGHISVEACRGLCRAAGGDRQRKFVYTLLLIDDPRPQALTEAIQAGVDDFLARPIVYGELLARLRAGARVLEYERRVREQAGWDALTGLLSRAAFTGRLRRELRGTVPLACVLLELDDLACVHQAHGDAAVDELVRAVAGSLDEPGGQCEILAHLEGGRFAIALPSTSEAQAAEWAEKTRRTVSETRFACQQAELRTTLSAGVAGDETGLPDPEILLKRASEALELAHRSGHDCVACYGQCEEDERQWRALAEPGKLFAETLARHVMTPATLTLRADDELSHVAALFRRSGLPAAAVVDAQGHLEGVITRKSMGAADAQGSGRRIRDVMTTDMVRLSEDTGVIAVLDQFRTGRHSLAVVVDGKVPTGIITRSGLAALIEPLASDTFAPRTAVDAGSAYLLVPDVCALGGI